MLLLLKIDELYTYSNSKINICYQFNLFYDYLYHIQSILS